MRTTPRPLAPAFALVLALQLVLGVGTSCALLEPEIAAAPPPLADMEEPLALQAEPDDEPERLALPAGGFTGIYVSDARRSLDALLAEPEGVLVTRVVENSPGAMAGIVEGDLLLEVEAEGELVVLQWPSQWREIELAATPERPLLVIYDRAGAELEASIVPEPRVAPPDREPAGRFREEKRVGVVVRTATEVEARAAGVGPGGGAVIVGLSLASPWRAAGLRFGDVLIDVEGREIAHPQVLLDAILSTPTDETLALSYMREGEILSIEAPLTTRDRELQSITIPLLFSYEKRNDKKELSVLLGLFGYESTNAAWKVRLLWLLTFGGGDSDRLEEVEA